MALGIIKEMPDLTATSKSVIYTIHTFKLAIYASVLTARVFMLNCPVKNIQYKYCTHIENKLPLGYS